MSYKITDPLNIPWPNNLLLVDAPTSQKPVPLQRPLSVVGTLIPRTAGIDKASGAIKYADDNYDVPGLLHAKILRSPYARANVVSVDTSKAEALPGVQMVLSPKNSYFYSMWYSLAEPMFYKTIPYQGAEVAAVVADDIDTAEQAIKLIDVQYQPLSHLTTIQEALSPNAPLLDPTLPNNLVPTSPSATTKIGDALGAIAKADKVVEEQYTFGSTTHACMQTRSIVAHWDGTSFTALDSHQNVHQNRNAYGQALGLPLEQVRVISPFVGGGFGSKGSGPQRFAFIAAYLSLLLKQPVMLHLTRQEECLVHPHRFQLEAHMKSGVMNDGTIVGTWARTTWNGGAPASSFSVGSFNSTMTGAYNIPAYDLVDTWVLTNTGFTGPQRSVATIWCTSAIESHMDSLAAALGMDPMEFRLKNYSAWSNPPTNTIPFVSKKQDQTIQYVTKQIGWNTRDQFKAQSKDPMYYGMGLSMWVYSGGGSSPYKDYPIVEIDNQANITLRVGIVDIGGDQPGTYSVIVAEELGVTRNDVTAIWGDTQQTAYACSQNATRTVGELGPPVLQAAYQAKIQLLALAAPMLGVPASALESVNGMIYEVSNPSNQISFKEVASHIQGTIVGEGSRIPNTTATWEGISPPVGKTFGSNAAKVSVNVDTGKVTVLDWATSYDCGGALNLLTGRGQMYGGTNQSIGHGLYERFIWDPNDGTNLSDDFLYYKLPTIGDVAPQVDPATINFVPSYDPFFAFGAKGIGEAPITGQASAIRNAVYHATGVLVNNYPLTPDNVLAALKAAGVGKF